jgi:hypothetical protein
MSETVHELLEQGETGAALARLLELWRDRRHPRLANLVDRLYPLVRSRAPVEGGTRKEQLVQWKAREQERRPEDLPVLLEHMIRFPRSTAQSAVRLDALRRKVEKLPSLSELVLPDV